MDKELLLHCLLNAEDVWLEDSKMTILLKNRDLAYIEARIDRDCDEVELNISVNKYIPEDMKIAQTKNELVKQLDELNRKSIQIRSKLDSLG